MTTLVVGATGSVGRLVVAEAIRQGHTVRALVRNAERAERLLQGAELFVGDVTRRETLSDAVAGVDAIIFTLGSDGTGRGGAEAVDYGGVRNTLFALRGRTARVALMTAIGVTNRIGDYNRATQAHDWKRRAERLLRASGLPYTIVRPGWFDYNAPDEHALVFLQGDKRQAGNSSDGVIDRRQIAQVLVASLSSDAAARKTFELVAVAGNTTKDFEPLFSRLVADPPGALDAVEDTPNMLLDSEPAAVRAELDQISPDRAAAGAR